MTAASMQGMLESDLEDVVWALQEISFLRASAGPKGSVSNRLM